MYNVIEGKIAVFGFLKRNNKVYIVVVLNTQSATLLPIIREQVKPDSIVYTDTYRNYDVLDASEFSHFRINHSTHFAEIIIILTELRIFGVKRSEYSENIME